MEKRKKKLGGYPAVGVVISITLALFVVGLFGLLVIFSSQLEREIRQDIKMEVYLHSNLTETQRLQIENKLLSQPFISTSTGRGIVFVSRDEAAEKLIRETGEDFVSLLGANPLKDAYLVPVDPSYHTPEKMQQVKSEIEAMKGVFQVSYVEGLITAVNKNVMTIALVLGGVIVILLIVVVLLINNTLRLALFSQRFLIRSMQLVGATHWFIQRPFVYRAMGYGFLGAVIAGGALWVLTNYSIGKLPDLGSLYQPELFLFLVGVMVLTGMMVATLSTYFSIKKYLKLSLDELY